MLFDKSVRDAKALLRSLEDLYEKLSRRASSKEVKRTLTQITVLHGKVLNYLDFVYRGKV